MEPLIYFLLGILFVEVAIPLIEALITIPIAWIEVLKGYATVKVSQLNLQIQQMELPETSNHVIGFEIPSEEDDENDI